MNTDRYTPSGDQPPTEFRVLPGALLLCCPVATSLIFSATILRFFCRRGVLGYNKGNNNVFCCVFLYNNLTLELTHYMPEQLNYEPGKTENYPGKLLGKPRAAG